MLKCSWTSSGMSALALLVCTAAVLCAGPAMGDSTNTAPTTTTAVTTAASANQTQWASMAFAEYNISNGVATQNFDQPTIFVDSSMSLFISSLDVNGLSVFGTVYVPTLTNDDGGECSDLANIPSNVTRIGDLSAGETPIALVPYLNSTCGNKYFAQVASDNARAALVFSPKQFTQLDWLNQVSMLNTNFDYSAFVISNGVANNLLAYMILNPGSPFRVAGSIQSHQSSGTTSIWTYVLAILAGILAILILVSLAMHLIFYNKRRDLRRRLQSGEVDPVSLGMRQLTVPNEMIEKLPMRLYKFGVCDYSHPRDKLPVPPQPHKSWLKSIIVHVDPLDENKEVVPDTEMQIINRVPTLSTGYSQTNCAICLDDFTENVTLVRELPCLHIYHSECIDPFLRTRSALCPLCKASVLPKGYLPPGLVITNSTVQRERRLRMTREALERLGSNAPSNGRSEDSSINRMVNRIAERDNARRNSYVADGISHHHLVTPINNTTETATTEDPFTDNGPIITHNQSVLDAETRHDLEGDTPANDLSASPLDDHAERPRSGWSRAMARVFPTF